MACIIDNRDSLKRENSMLGASVPRRSEDFKIFVVFEK
jgi:hypothetical protein